MTGAQTPHLAFRSWHGWPVIAPRLSTRDRQNILWMRRSASQMLPLRLVPMSLHCQQPECLLAPPETCHWRKCSPSNGTKLFRKVIASLVLSLNAPTLYDYFQVVSSRGFFQVLFTGLKERKCGHKMASVFCETGMCSRSHCLNVTVGASVAAGRYWGKLSVPAGRHFLIKFFTDFSFPRNNYFSYMYSLLTIVENLISLSA